MLRYKVKILVNRKDEIKDPQAVTLENTLKRLEVELESKVKIGNFFELELTASDEYEVKEKAQEIAKEFLSNVLLETFEIIEIEKL